MRLLITCSDCHRRYDASRFGVGARVRCGCGHVMRVQQPKAHDAAVVRCSSCGSPREKGQNHCGFCDSDFTLHERDLHTVCPQCFARVSDRARFCHACGDRLTAEAVAGETSQFSCPACGIARKLMHRRLGKERISVAECQQCAGLWIHQSSFCHLRDRAVREGVDVRIPPGPIRKRRVAAPIRYRPCAECGELMNRREYARGCGVIVDVCREHGIWFDDEELADVIDWISRGGSSKLREGFRTTPLEIRGESQSASAPLRPTDSSGARHYGLSGRQGEGIHDGMSDIMQAALGPLARLLDL